MKKKKTLKPANMLVLDLFDCVHSEYGLNKPSIVTFSDPEKITVLVSKIQTDLSNDFFKQYKSRKIELGQYLTSVGKRTHDLPPTSIFDFELKDANTVMGSLYVMLGIIENTLQCSLHYADMPIKNMCPPTLAYVRAGREVSKKVMTPFYHYNEIRSEIFFKHTKKDPHMFNKALDFFRESFNRLDRSLDYDREMIALHDETTHLKTFTDRVGMLNDEIFNRFERQLLPK